MHVPLLALKGINHYKKYFHSFRGKNKEIEVAAGSQNCHTQFPCLWIADCDIVHNFTLPHHPEFLFFLFLLGFFSLGGGGSRASEWQTVAQ